MQIQIDTSAIEQAQSDALVVVAHEGAMGKTATAADKATGGWISALLATKELTGKLLEIALLARPAGLKAKRLIVAGGGKRDAFSATELRRVVGAALRVVKPKKCTSMTLA